MKKGLLKTLALTLVCSFSMVAAGCEVLNAAVSEALNSLTSEQSNTENDTESESKTEDLLDSSEESGDISADNSDVSSDSDAGNVEDIVTQDFSIHFLELGNKYTGDCTLIDVGDTEVLIDAGSRKNSATTISSYVQKYCEDGVLEYVIATHADQDHIAGFVGNSGTPIRTGILYQYEVERLIQFPLTGKSALTDKGNKSMYGEYLDAVEYAKGKGAVVYTALECWNNANGAQRSYDLGGGVTMNFLYQRFYEETTSDENDYSVCMLLTQGENNYLFTGDLEHRGEASLVEKNSLPECE